MMSGEVKWACEYCTYDNYHASNKCVLCHAPRPLQVISDLQNQEQDIYKVAELSARNVTSSGSSSSNKDSDKWSCSMCTYLNWPSATRCAQCCLPRRHNITRPSTPSPDASTPLTVKTNLNTCPGGSGLMPDNKSSPVSPEGASASKNTAKTVHLNKAIAAYLKNTIKWSCKACTYGNYPRSKHCTICGTAKGHPYLTKIASTSNDKSLALHVEIKNEENIKSAQNSPTTASCQNDNATSLNKHSGKNRSGQVSPVNHRGGHTGSSNSSGQNSPKGQHSPNSTNSGQVSPNNKSGQNSPNNRSAQVSPNNRTGQTPTNTYPVNVFPYSNNQASPSSYHSGTNSPLIYRSDQISPGSRSGQVSPARRDSVPNSPVIARASIVDNQNRNRRDSLKIVDGAGAIGGPREEDKRERRIQKLRKKLSDSDLIWLNACESVVNGDLGGIEIFLTSGGDPGRQLTKDEVFILDRPSAFEAGYTLVHLALRFRRDDMVAILLTANDISSKGFKRLPSYVSPDIAADVRREISILLRQRKGGFPCYFMTDCTTFSLPAEIEDLPPNIQAQLFDEILDVDVDKELTDEAVINWSLELTEKLGSRLYALWNRTAGDCLLDSVLEATWGILDIDNTLRRALSDSLLEATMSFYPKWKEYEMLQAQMLNFTLDEGQWQRDWAILLSIASQPGASLEQLHIFALAHILRRPVIVYGVKVVKSFRGESIDFARFEGVYLPLLWERNFCWKSPIALGYTRGHFSALVPMEIDTNIPMGAGAHIDNAADEQITYLPLVDHEGSFLPIHFVTGTEGQLGQEESLFRRWFDCCVTQEGLFVAIQKIGKRPAAVKQMMESWMDYYRQQSYANNEADVQALQSQTFSSDGESDQE